MRLLTPVLETKLYVPRPRAGWVPRPRLSERLDKGLTLTLISAPAGFGKTTLLAAAAEKRSVAWLSLDAGDNDPATFWTYVVAALRSVAPEVGALPESSQPVPVGVMLTPLLNDLGALTREIVLVLDDYHHIDAREIQDGMAFLLDRVPPNLRVVIAGRADPLLPLARLRAQGELVEIRAADLRFTPDEAATYLNETMGLQLTARDVAALEERTEGWIAALQLAALSMQGRDDVTAFIDGFAGTDRFVVDYLVEEVVQRQPAEIQSFLLQTSVLGRLSGSLCDALTGQVDGKTVLAELERGNLFLVPLDDRRQWYRYHHLFADVMHARLLDEQPDQVPVLHRRASAWYEQYGDLAAAINHALAAADFERAADLIEVAIPGLRRERQESTMIGWLGRLPDELVRERPELNVAYAGALLSIGAVDEVEPRLQDASRDSALGGWIAVYRAGLALMRGDNAATVTQGRQALELLEDDDHLGHGAATGLLGLASWSQGDLEAAHTAYTDCMTSLVRVGFLSDALGCSITLADIAITQGRLREAMRIYERALELGQDGPVLRGTADMYVGLSAIHRERNELPAALELLQRSQLLGDAMGMPQNPYRSRVAMARIREASGDLAGAAELLDEAERLYFGDFSPEVRPVAAMKARLWIRQGKVDDALAWARGLPADLVYLREFEHITLARALLAAGSLDEARELLEGLLREAETGGRIGSVIEILVLQALALDLPGGLVPLERAVALASPEGYVRVFVDEGPAMLRLLKAAAKQGIPVGHLVSALTGSEVRPQGLPDSLSGRELVVLRLLGSELTGPDIARELTVSLNTLRTHTKNIYLKLGVNNRRAAVRRADELGLLTRSR